MVEMWRMRRSTLRCLRRPKCGYVPARLFWGSSISRAVKLGCKSIQDLRGRGRRVPRPMAHGLRPIVVFPLWTEDILAESPAQDPRTGPRTHLR